LVENAQAQLQREGEAAAKESTSLNLEVQLGPQPIEEEQLIQPLKYK